jgi:bifunctional non-homologous end joining protein LigD
MPTLPKTSPIKPVLRSRRFDHSDYLFELKYDGFRAMACLHDGTCELISRNKRVFEGFKTLRLWLAGNIQVRDAIIDGEICCLDESGKPCFNDLTTGSRDPYFVVFDLLWLDGEDLRALPLIERKKRLAAIVPAAPAFLLYVDHVEEKGRDLFGAVCATDLEGIVAKPKNSPYDPTRTKWIKIKNPNYSQKEGRREMFNSFMGYNDFAHVRELTKEVTWAASSRDGRDLWPKAEKTGVAYQESFVLREPSTRVQLTQTSRKPARKTALPRSKQTFSDPDFVMWPGDGITKGDLIRYYDKIAPFLLPHIESRPLMLERHPKGVGER